MLRRIFVGLASIQLLIGNPVLADSDAANIRSLRASAMQHVAQGQVEIGMRSFGDAIRLAEKSFGKDSTYVADLCFDAGVAALKKDQYKDAESFLTKAVGLNPNASEARLKLAEYYKMKGRLADAKTQLNKVLAHDPINVEARELLALTYQKEGNAARATEECWRLEQISTGHSDEITVAQVGAMPAPAPPPMPVTTAPAPLSTGKLGGFQRLVAPAPLKPAEAPPTPKPEEQPKEATPPAAKTPAPAPAPAPKAPSKQEQLLRLQQQERELERQLAKHSKKERSRKETKKDRKHKGHQYEAPPVDDTGAFGVTARLHSKAKILNAAKNMKGASSDSDNAAGVVAPPPQPVPRHGRTPKGMVPPPPPVVPVFQPPMPVAPPKPVPLPQPKPAASAPKLIQATPKEDPGEETHSGPFARSSGSGSSSSSAGSSSSSDDDGDFLLDWAGKKKKKK